MYGRDGWFRITIGSAEENQMAIHSGFLHPIVDERPGRQPP